MYRPRAKRTAAEGEAIKKCRILRRNGGIDMKKIAAVITAMAMMTGLTAFAEEMASEYKYDENGKITAYYGDENVVVPSETGGAKITEIGDKVFFDLDISYVFINEGIEKIGTSAFEGSNLYGADMPSTLKSVSDRAFANCEYLEEMYFSSSDTEFGKDAFAGTKFIKFFFPCSSDFDALSGKIKSAKGDENYGLGASHNLAEDEMDGDVLTCIDCGQHFDRGGTMPFEDVSPEDWFGSYVYMAYVAGILNGKSETAFDPSAGLTCGETAKIAASIYALREGVEDFPEDGNNWYDKYVNYCYNNGILEEHVVFDWNAPATRAQVAYLFSRCDSRPYTINEVPLTDIPDVHDTTPFAYEILDLYNRGIAAGSDEQYTFHPDSNIMRSEAAALVARLLYREMRIELPKG